MLKATMIIAPIDAKYSGLVYIHDLERAGPISILCLL